MTRIKNILIIHNGALGDFLCAWPGIYSISRHWCRQDLNFWFFGREFALFWLKELGLKKAPPEIAAAIERMYVYNVPPAWLEETFVFWFCLKQPVTVVKHHNIISIPVLNFSILASDEQADPLVIQSIREQLKRLEIPWRAEWRATWQDYFGKWENTGSRQVALLPGTGHLAKSWDLDNFEILSKLLDNAGFDPVYLLGPVERERGILPLMARAEYPVPPQELAARMMKMQAVIACDGGPAHLASHHAIPGLVLFGPVNWRAWAPEGLDVVLPPAGMPTMFCPAVDDPKDIDVSWPSITNLIDPEKVFDIFIRKFNVVG